MKGRSPHLLRASFFVGVLIRQLLRKTQCVSNEWAIHDAVDRNNTDLLGLAILPKRSFSCIELCFLAKKQS